ncbi:hypothetical protein BJ322DRAFT_621405 [Thelephora terrestris]|uniref:Probable RNA-binding protein 18 n=1 Tax=Thelephora terrestris TaxID=56493 RepID=A0A9P6L8R2_9AGAM|nr:hypothetical protein BJ322DRAFT_621405 [Thelephora terrestris]
MSDPGPSAAPPSSTNPHLTFPSEEQEPESQTKPATPVPAQKQLLPDRLYVGNLHPSVDEFALVQIFSKFGKISHLDFLFHKTGMLRGKPRGYAFVQYANKDDAQRALSTANGKLVRGRKIVVTYAQQAPLENFHTSSVGGKARKVVSDAGRPTALSLLKTGESSGGRSDGTKNKIALMEAKLKQMARKSANSSQDHRPSPSQHSRSRPSSSHNRSAPPKPLPELLLSKQSIFPRTQPSAPEPKP